MNRNWLLGTYEKAATRCLPQQILIKANSQNREQLPGTDPRQLPSKQVIPKADTCEGHSHDKAEAAKHVETVVDAEGCHRAIIGSHQQLQQVGFVVCPASLALGGAKLLGHLPRPRKQGTAG